MTDIEKAIETLSSGQVTFAAVRDGELRTSDKKGIVPILGLIDSEPHFLNGASVADKVIGKAAAMLLYAYGVKSIHTPLTSKNALNYISGKSISFEYGEVAEYIINRDGTDMCPMEKAVLNIENEKEAERLVRNKLEELRRA